MRPRQRFIKRLASQLLIATALCLLCACMSALAQSGRRVQKRPPPSPPPVPEAKPMPTAPVIKTEQAQLSFYVSMSERDPYVGIPYYVNDTIRNVFVQRLGESSAVRVTSGKESHRSEAIKRAKSEESTYVVLLQLEPDSDPRGPNARNVDYSRVFIRYSVFAPVTGKSKLEGRVYQQQYRTGRGGVGLPSPTGNNPLYSDYLLKEAAREAADRVLAEFQLGSPTPRGPGRY